MSKTVYVAETDENGAIVCVWVNTDGQRSARPFNPRKHILNANADVEFSGAQPKAIKSWLAVRKAEPAFTAKAAAE